MPNRHQPQPPEHPQEAHTRAEQAERQKNAGKAPPAPHPSQAMAEALGTDPHRFDREAVAAFQAGKPKVAERAQAKADEAVVETAAAPAPGAVEKKG